MREDHVRFCEGPRVKLLRPTHPYIPMARGFVYLAAVMDVFSRRVLARVSITMEAISASRRSKKRWPGTAGPRSSTPIRAASSPAPASPAFCWIEGRDQHGRRGRLARQCVRRAAVARVKYEEVYLHAYDSVAEGEDVHRPISGAL